MLRISLFVLLFGTLLSACVKTTAPLMTAGAMNKMKENGYKTVFYLDTIDNKANLYGLGPYNEMRGEITIYNGIPLHVEALADDKAEVGVSWDVRTPFFVYSNVPEWEAFKLTTSLNSTADIQREVEAIAEKRGYDLQEPFAFRLTGTFDSLVAHIVTPRTPEVFGYEEGTKSRKFPKTSITGELIGFYSQKHQGIFTGSKSFVHVHIVSKDLTFVGHLDKLHSGNKTYTLYLPKRM